MNIKFSPPDISEQEINEVIDTLKSGWVTTGPKTKELERELAAYCKTEKFACFNSATAAMELTLRLFGIGEGDEVITSAYTYTASASVICHVGAKPIIVDTCPDSFEISPDAIEAAITEKTKAVITVDIGGVICNYKKIIEVLESKKSLFSPKNNMQSSLGRVLLLADAAHSFGSTREGLQSGQHADFSCFSFHAVKNLTMAEGGGVTWKELKGISSEDIYKTYMLYSLHGQTKDALTKTMAGGWEYDISFPGYKCNLTDIMASMGLVQLKRYGSLLEKREKIVNAYNNILENLNLEILRHRGESFVSNKHLYIVRIIGKQEEYRNNVIKKMAERGIATNVHFKPLPLLTAYKNLGFDIKDFPNALDRYRNAVSLPIHTLLSEEEISYVAENFADIVTKE